MNKSDGIINLLENVPESIKNKVISFSNKETILTGKIELTVIFGENELRVREAVAQIGGKFEGLGYGFGIVTVDVKDIEKVASIKEILYVELPKTLYTSAIESVRASCIDQVWDLYKLSGKGVIVGFIDSGIDYTHPAFIDFNGETRIEYIYNLYTNEVWSKDDINKALKSNEPYSIVPEKDDIGHGTHVAGIACAGGKIDRKYYGAAYNSSIIMVKMTAPGKVNYAQSTQLLRGIAFLLSKSRELQKPLVINLSFSTNDGAHNGSSLLEQYINTVCSIERISFAIAAGNEGDRAHHVGQIIKPQQNIFFNIAPDESTLILQLYKDLLSEIDIELKNPQGISSGIIPIKEGFVQGNLAQDRYFIYYTGPKPFDINGEIVISLIALRDFLVSGQWTLTIYSKGDTLGNYNIWLPISEGLNKDTKFLQPNVYNTLGIPATVKTVISVGSYNPLTGTLSSFSGRGALNSDEPNIMSPGEAIQSSIPGGGFDALTGTSMAAPNVAGSCALLMEWGIVQGNDSYMYGARLKYFLLKGAKRDKPNVIYPGPNFGYGTLCLRNSIEIAELNKNRSNFKGDIYNMDRQNSINCGDIYTNEEYLNFIVEYDGDIIKALSAIEGACAFILDEDYAVISLPYDGWEDIIKNIKEIVFAQKSLLYTLCAISPIDAANISKFHENPFLTLRGQGVLVGMIDTGIDYLNQEFIYEDDTTRVISIWDQSSNQGKAPTGLTFGTEYTAKDINEAIAAKKAGKDPYSIVNSKDTNGHGTAMAGIIGARGRGSGVTGAAPDCEFSVVKLKQAKKNILLGEGIDSPRCAVYESTDIVLAIKYLYGVARTLNKPIVIYIPLGTNQGSHTGDSIMERYIDSISKTRGLAVVTGCGNEGDTETHASGLIEKTGDSKIIELKVDENQDKLNFQIWANKPDKVSLSITSPSGETTGKIPARLGETNKIRFVFEGSTVRIRYFLPEELTGDELIDINIENIKGGIWQFKLIGDSIVNGNFNSWLPVRVLLKPETRFLNSNQFTTLTLPSTSQKIISCSYYNQDNNSIVAASGRGYTRDNRVKPDVASGGINVLTTAVGGGTTVVSGSSAGAAVLAGAVALILEWGIVKGQDPTMYSTKVKTYLIRGATKRSGDIYPNPIFGYGILNLEGVFQNIRKLDRSSNESNIYISIPDEILKYIQ